MTPRGVALPAKVACLSHQPWQRRRPGCQLIRQSGIFDVVLMPGGGIDEVRGLPGSAHDLHVQQAEVCGVGNGIDRKRDLAQTSPDGRVRRRQHVGDTSMTQLSAERRHADCGLVRREYTCLAGVVNGRVNGGL